MSRRDELVQALRARLEHVIAAEDLSLALDPVVAADARELAEILREPDVEALYLVGAAHWLRHLALPEGADQEDLDKALVMLTPCLVFGVPDLPEELLPVLAERAVPMVTSLIRERVLVAADPEAMDAAVAVWRRIVDATPAGHPRRPSYLAALGDTLRMRYERTGSADDLEEAVEICREAARGLPPGVPEHPLNLSTLGVALQARYGRTGARADLDSAIDICRRTVEAVPADHADRSLFLSNLGNALGLRYGAAGDPADLDAAVEAGRQAVESCPADHPSLAMCLSNLANLLLGRFARTGATGDVEQAIAAVRRAVDATPADHPNRGTYLTNLSGALWGRFGRTGDDADLEAATEAARAAVEAAPPGSPLRGVSLFGLGNALWSRYERNGDEADLDEAVAALDEGVRASADGGPFAAAHLSGLGNALRARYERKGVQADLDAAIDTGRRAYHLSSAEDPNRGSYLSNLGNALRLRFERAGDLADGDEAVAVLRRAVGATPGGHAALPMHLGNLGGALLVRFARTGALTDVDEAVAVLERAVATTSGGDPNLPMFLGNLGSALWSRYERSGQRRDVDQAIAVLTRALELVPAGHPNLALYLSSLGNGLRMRYVHTGAASDLDEAIAAGRRALAETPADHPYLARFLGNLGSALWIRFQRSGAQADLDESIEIGRRAVDATPGDHPALALFLSNLGGSLRIRFEWSGERADLDEAITAGRRAVDATPAGHPNRPMYLSNLSVSLRGRAVRTRTTSDLDEAVEFARQAAEAAPGDHPNRPIYLTNLGITLVVRFEVGERPADLDAAVVAARQAVASAPAGHPNRPMYLTNLGSALRSRFTRTGNPADGDEAVQVVRLAAETAPEGHTNRVQCLINLGATLRERFRRAGDPADLDEALSAYERAARTVTAPPSDRVRAGRAGAELVAASRPGRAADLLEEAVRLLPELAPRYLERSDQQYALGRFAGLAADAAALALADPDAPADRAAARALSLLESARAVLLSQALNTRSDLTDLRERRPDLAGEFVRLRDLLDRPPADPTPAPIPPEGDALAEVTVMEDGGLVEPVTSDTADLVVVRDGAGPVEAVVGGGGELGEASLWEHGGRGEGAVARAFARAARDRRRLTAEFAAVLEEIRGLDGLGSFALPPTTEELLAQAEDGPVVALNVSEHRSDALLLTRDGITALPLPALTHDTVIDRVVAFHRALRAVTAGATPPDRRAEAQTTLRETLEWLWEAAAEPVLSALGYDAAPGPGRNWPRVWWAPGGLLGLLPVHAAGHHTDPPGPGRRTVMDRVISSYTPTITALRHARRHTHPTPSGSPGRDARTGWPGWDRQAQGPGRPSEPGFALIVAMPSTPGLPGRGVLPNVPAEVRLLQARLPRPVLLAEPAPGLPAEGVATKANVLAHLPGAGIAHFACHGHADPADPSQSRLLLHDHEQDPLSVAGLAPVALDHARLAYLSACGTAVTTVASLSDEAIHLASAFQLAGFPHVIGTLWEINDRIAVEITGAFYAALDAGAGVLDTGLAAHALHRAVRTVRDRFPSAPSLWAAHVHAGA
ncbi:hypothetical protein Ssi03_19100 [Sphaerisporangium siamense]|uniref:Tetratricopeptide (TPR) repeat protein n=1 Tax=Sphaerisporangium siamense TaxID=795645 RepID=A0A7W7GE41_9ACTN|nr:CHAT domain-containing tetratricopeptide repeat protein [Sphaerisporangium siamense]MBB4705114.1 tetratricopeptide (TPR) repeat protein [Sphaerisporangium siamense]GII83920.1 hypothetical protein Ssi03_19100 [Sphaerisporangium siamense]